ncbi:hypothetical protein ACHAQJ_007949 [Trichoderma viride]
MPYLEIFGSDIPYPSLLERVGGDGVTEPDAAKASSYAVDQPDLIKVNGGVVTSLSVRYTNGLLATVGTAGSGRSTAYGQVQCHSLCNCLRFYTHRGPDLLGNSEDWKLAVKGESIHYGVQFEDFFLKHFDALLVNAQIERFWGYGGIESDIFRLASICGNKERVAATIGNPVDDTVDPPTVVTDEKTLYFSGDEHLGCFAKPLPIVPTVIYGFRITDVAATNSPRVALKANAMVLLNGKIPFHHGYLDASDTSGGRAATQNATLSVTFGKRSKPPPKVYVWFTKISQPRGHRSLRTYVQNVSSQGMDVHIDTWGGGEFESARVARLAWPAEFGSKTVRASNDFLGRGMKRL